MDEKCGGIMIKETGKVKGMERLKSGKEDKSPKKTEPSNQSPLQKNPSSKKGLPNANLKP
jgi:hypothetical protein